MRFVFPKGNNYWKLRKTLSGKDHPNFNNSFFAKKLSETKKRLFKEGKLKSWAKGLTKETDIRLYNAGKKISKTKKERKLVSWNKGLTKEDPRVLKISENSSKTKKEKFARGESIIWNKGLTKNDPRVKKYSEFLKGKPKSEEQKTKLSITRKSKIKKGEIKIWNKGLPSYLQPCFGIKRPDIKRLNQDPEFIKNRFQKLLLKPNKGEFYLINLINECKLGYEYTGDGRFLVGTRNPDFVDIKNKRIIELFGDFWHSERIKNVPKEEHIKERKEYFKKYGYNTLIIWWSELKDKEAIIDKIKLFENPIK